MTDIYYNPLGKKYTTQIPSLPTNRLSDVGYVDRFNNDTSLVHSNLDVNNNEKIYSGDTIKKMRNSNLIINAMLDDSRIQNKSNDLYLAILSSVTGISIIVFMILLRNINTK